MPDENDVIKLVAAVGIFLVVYAFYTQIQNWFPALTPDQNTGVIGGIVLVGVVAFLAVRSRL